ncbi:MAG TPA: sugar-binding domain-containing protein [Xanthobacteraceae bacterium]
MPHGRICLDGIWEFRHVGSGGEGSAKARSIDVPGPWQAQFEDLRARAGIGLYSRIFELPEGWARDRVFLRFGAVFHRAEVWVNGAHVGKHDNGFLPFSFDITDQIAGRKLEIKVRVESPTDDPAEFPRGPLSEIPFGKQGWYGPLSGIWQSVYLERRIADHIARARIVSEQATGDISVEVAFAAELIEPAEVIVTVTDPQGHTAGTASKTAAARLQSIVMQTRLAQVRPWSPDEPQLYALHACMRRNGMVVDEVHELFGFRSIETRHGRLYLNGKPFYLRAALDQDYYPDTTCSVPSLEFLEAQFRKAKELGLNALRCHLKLPDPRYYEAADRIGLLIWAELPNAGLSTARSRAQIERTLAGMLDRDGNHPCIFCWTLINESWGLDLIHDPLHRQWLKQLYAHAKAQDPSRLVVDNSPIAPGSHLRTDIADYHFYAAMPDRRAEWDDFAGALGRRAHWLFGPEEDAKTTGGEPLICSEFGNWGLPDPEQLLDREGREPWWLERGHDWGEGVAYPHGAKRRFNDWSLDRVFGDFASFVLAAQWQQFRALKYQIESLRRQSAIAGYVITQFTDVHWECNGLLDMRRNPRAFHGIFPSINADTVIVPRWSRLAYWSGETAGIGIAVAHGGAGPLEPGMVHVVSDGRELGALAAAPMQPHEVRELGEIKLTIPDTDSGRMQRLELELRSESGTVLARNHLDLAVQPRRTAGDLRLRAWSPQPEVRERLRAMGYGLAAGVSDAALVVATAPEPWLAPFVRNGGRLVLLANAECQIEPFFPHWQKVKVVAREGTPWRGDWVSAFAWLRRHGPFARLPGGPLIDATFDRVIPQHVITGCNLLDFHARVHAGLTVGWVHRPAALCVERNYGVGRVVASTFRLLRDAPGADPTATSLLDGMIETANRP